MLASVLVRLGRIWGDEALDRAGCRRPPPPRAGDGARAPSVRVVAVHARPPSVAAARARDRRGRGLGRSRAPRSRRSSPHGRRRRAVGGRAAARGQGARRRSPRGLRLRAVRVPRTRDASRGCTDRFRRMATTELTGAEEVAWDLGDLYEGPDDPRIESDITAAEADAAAFRERYHGKVGDARRRGARRGGRGARAHRGRGRSAADVCASPLRDEHGRSRARRARRAAAGEGGGARDAAPLLRARVGCGRRRDRRGRARRTRRSTTGATTCARSASSARTCSPSPRRRSSPRSPSPASAPGRGSTRSSSAPCASGWTTTRCRSRRRWRGCSSPTAMRAGRLPRRSPRRSARAPHPHVRLQHDPARQVDRRPAARLPDVDLLAQPRERDDGRGRRGARRGDDVPVRGRRSGTTA